MKFYCKVAFVFAICLSFCINIFSQETSADIFEPVVDAQNKIQEEYDNQAMEEEERLAQSRTDAQNEAIKKYEATVRSAAEKLENVIVDDGQLFLQNLEQVEEAKNTITRLRTEDLANASAVEYAAQVNLDKSYKVLESKTYTATSFGQNITLRGYTFNNLRKRWTVSIYSNFFGYTTLFDIDVPLTYADLTGKEAKSLLKMSKEEREAYNTDIMVFDSMFRKTIPVVYARLKYKLRRWKNASEYRFEPVSLDIIRTDTNKVVASFEAEDLPRSTFIVYPQVEIRTPAERNSDIETANKVLANEKQVSQENAVASAESSGKVTVVESKKAKVEQKGRSTFYVSADTRITNKMLEDFDAKDVMLSDVTANITVGLRKFCFVGADFGYDYHDDGRNNSSFSGGILGGFNIRLGKFVRPYTELVVNYHTNSYLSPELGVGMDFTIGKVMLNLGYDFGWNIDVSDIFDGGSITKDGISNYHLLTVGFGFTWN